MANGKVDSGMMSDREINLLAKQLGVPNFVGALADDQLGYLCGYAAWGSVINYQSSGEGGTHWVGVCGRADKHSVLVFDSLGFPPDDRIEELDYQMTYNDHRVQSDHSSVCGLYALLFCRHIGMGGTWSKWMALWDTQHDEVGRDRNDQKVVRMLNSLLA